MEIYKFTDCVEVVGSACPSFEGEKHYISTGAVEKNMINETKVEIVSYDEKPSRANLVVEAGTLLFAKMQATKKTVLIDDVSEQYVYSTGFCAIKPIETIINQNCLYHLLMSDMFLKQKDKNCSGATQKAITNAGLKKIIISVPPLEQQDSIAEKLDLISELIKNQRKGLQKLDELINSRFVEMFGDPVSNPFKWDKVPLSELADIKIGPFGSLLHKDDYIENGHPLVNPSHIKDGKIVTDNKLTISDEKFGEMAAYHLKIGDVVMGRRGEMGRCAVVNEDGLLCGTGSLLIRSKGEVSADYIQKIISFPSFRKIIEDMAVGQTMPNLNVPLVSNFKIIKPPIGVQHKYYSFVHQVEKLKSEEQKKLEQTQTLFDSLMQKYFG